jgi:hypothetical protein
MQKVITFDTLLLIQRRLEIQAPLNEFLEKPISFYSSYIKRYLKNYDCYRTYSLSKITSPRISCLDYSTMFPTGKKEERALLVNRRDSLSDILKEREVIEKLLKSDEKISIDNRNARRMIIKRFGSVENFYDAVRKLDSLVDDNQDVDDIYKSIKSNMKK